MIHLKNGYWRRNNKTDVILPCVNLPANCIAQNPKNRFYCLDGHSGPLCEACDNYGKIWGRKYQTMAKFKCIACNDLLS